MEKPLIPPRPTKGTVLGDDFEITGPLNEGGMGGIYTARQRSTGAKRAIKLMHQHLIGSPALRKRFEQEAKVGAQIESDHAVQVIAAGVDGDGGVPWIAMEFLEGEDLGARLSRDGALSLEDAKLVFAPLFHAVGAAHRAGIVHRDLKPENVFIAKGRRPDERFTVKVLDFGIAKVKDEAMAASTEAIGTPMWMAPEQTIHGSEIGPAADVWALGLIVFYVLTGKRYWRAASREGLSLPQLLREIAIDRLESALTRATELNCAAALPVNFDTWFSKTVVRDPSMRFADANAAYDALRAILEDGSRLRAPLPSSSGIAVPPLVAVPLIVGDRVPPAPAIVKGQVAPKPVQTMSSHDAPPGFAQNPVMAAFANLPLSKEASVPPPVALTPVSAPRIAAETEAKPSEAKIAEPPLAGTGPAVTKREEPAPVAAKAPDTVVPFVGKDAHFSSAPPRFSAIPRMPDRTPMSATSDRDAPAAPRANNSSLRAIAIATGVIAIAAIGWGIRYEMLHASTTAANATAAPDTASSNAAPSMDAIRNAESKRAASIATGKRKMIRLEGAEFTVGSKTGALDEQPPYKETLASFQIDQREVTVDDYQACVDVGRCTAAGEGEFCNGSVPGRGLHPINCVDWKQAETYCAWIDRRLPTEAEWEFAARGKTGRVYPWGEAAPNDQLCWGRCKTNEGTCEVGAHPAGDTPEGIEDMAGNVWEWTSSSYCPYNQRICAVTQKVARGNGWCGSDSSMVRMGIRQANEPATRSANLGMRCARTL